MGLFDRLFGKKKETEKVVEEVEVKEEVAGGNDESEEHSEPVEYVIFSEQAGELLNETMPEILAELGSESSPSDEERENFQEESDVLEEEIKEIESSELAEEVVSLEKQNDEQLSKASAPVEAQEEKTAHNLEEKYDKSLEKTRKTFGERFNAFLANFRSVDEEFFEELEETLIMSDVGVDLALEVTEELRHEAKLANAKSQDALRQLIVEKIVDKFDDEKVPSDLNLQEGLTVFLFVGVNGVGKTTTIGKLAHR
ncbi:MAG TPA: signal recognition particle-docking protein FtsY, partial [Lactococcus sp.]|nr:signal recognition particle-docking protein FtsY [Lactococcus sp.]